MLYHKLANKLVSASLTQRLSSCEKTTANSCSMLSKGLIKFNNLNSTITFKKY